MITSLRKALFGFLILFTSLIQAQELIKGRVIDEVTEEPIPSAIITVKGLDFKATSNADGYFVIEGAIPVGDQTVQVVRTGYYALSLPVVISLQNPVDLDPLYMTPDNSLEVQSQGIISLTENDLADDENAANNVSGLLMSARDQFLRAAAFDFSATFFRPRGLNSEDGKVLINGIEMNKQFSGRPQWSNWGGLNDIMRNQVFTMGLSAADDTFGGYGGVQSINMRASQQRPGSQISYASSNRSYQHRLMASYRSGLMNNGWAYAINASRRAGEEGFTDGTPYDANSLGISVEKKFNDKHSLNFTGMYTPNRRGRRTAITQEIRDLKGITYNPFWGELNNDERNSRIREIEEPILMLNHYWDVNPKLRVNTNVAYQFGKIGNTRIDNGGTTQETIDGQNVYVGGARNPNPDYYQNLPSYFLRNGSDPIDFQYAYLAEQAFINDGQLDWNSLYEANRVLADQGRNALYVLQEDRIDDKLFSANTIITADITDNILFNGGIRYRTLNSDNYARIDDLLGGTGYLDVDFFAEESVDVNLDVLAQSDVRNPNRIVGLGDRYKYSYEIDSDVISSFAQAQFKTAKVDFFLSGSVSQTSYQRNGKFENGNFQGDRSFGKSDKVDFTDFGVKGGATYKINGQNFLDFHAAYMTQAPYIRTVFSNARQNNDIVDGIESQRSYSADLSYVLSTPNVKARLTAYYTKFMDGSDVGFYFTEDLTGLPLDDGSAFVQEVMTNIDRRNMGLEMGLEVQATPTIKLKAAAALGQNVFTNNPDLYLTSDDFNGQLRFGDGTAKLDGYHVAGGPETALQIGFEYRDPDYWNIGLTTNYFANGYIDVNALRRSDNFILDYDGQVFNDYDQDLANELLAQEQFEDYVLVNVIGGKSWKIGDKFVGFFATINNVFDREYKTGGFEQARNSNFRSVRDDQNNPQEVFAPRYFFGNGTTYYLNVYLRF
ncbi:TonB-dependent receptor [Nonlabens tegetincola]|uniref:carboxypeptidase regulatory-like domain-containing protein n=1 Tax=Nonlabens tegetincola TaxID=323273 RepID=UPI000A20AEF2|nr:carboxypeptidase regulatory-like domain-containing protein [Nonlabens tegetincola]ARN72420.1 TonB-dependent receptor [Nonlabens tegetincola]